MAWPARIFFGTLNSLKRVNELEQAVEINSVSKQNYEQIRIPPFFAHSFAGDLYVLTGRRFGCR